MNPRVVLIASGSEVGIALRASEILNSKGTPTRVVSMPCWEFFDAQPLQYRKKVLPENVVAKIAIEAGSSLGWAKYVGSDGIVMGVDKFGVSAPAEEVFAEYGFTVSNVITSVQKLLKKR